jgi:hypothetical protein
MSTKKPSLLEMAAAAVPASAQFDLAKDEIVKQVLSVPLVKVLPASPTVAMLFDSATINMMRIKTQKNERLYLIEPELAKDPALAPYIFRYQIASGKTGDGDLFLSYCQQPNPENPNRFHTSGIRAMQIALKEPVSKRPFNQGDDGYTVMRFGPGAKEVPTIKKPDYNLDEMLELAFDGREILGPKSAVIMELNALQAVE